MPKPPLKNPYEPIGRNIARLRTSAGLTQQAASDAAGLSIRYYQDLEAGLKCPSVPSLIALSVVLESSFDDLLKGAESLVPQVKGHDRKAGVPRAEGSRKRSSTR